MKVLWILFPEMTLCDIPKIEIFNFVWILFPDMTLFPGFGFCFQNSRIRDNIDSYCNLSYQIHEDSTLTINGERMRYRYDSGDDCYRLDGADVAMKLSKHQMNQEYLLGRPFYVQLISADSPK